MTLKDLFIQLGTGEMRTYSHGKDLLKPIVPEHTKLQVIANLNLGLQTLYSQFLLLQEELILQLNPNIVDYLLTSKHAQTNLDPSPDIVKYIMDSDLHPFKDNIVRIMSVVNEIGEELPLDDESQTYSVFTKSYNILQVPSVSSNNALGVRYHALLPQIPYNIEEPYSYEINIHPMAVTALLYFVGSRIHVNLNKANTMSEANFFFNKYNTEIAKLNNMNIEIEYNYINDVHKKGWV